MLTKIDPNKNIKYTFIPKIDWNKNITLMDTIMSNDSYSKSNCNLNVDGEIIICNDLKKIDKFCKKIIQETYQEYLDFIIQRDFTKEQWVYNILDGISEQDKILYKDEKIIIIPNYTWTENKNENKNELSKLHILTFPMDKNIHCIRSLNSSHIELLSYCKTKTLEIIKNIYGFDQEKIKIFIHYAPTTYQLHIHFVLISNTDSNSSVEYSHELSNVIFNLSIKSDYYQIINMNKRI